MTFELPTVTIDHPDKPGQPMIINKSEYDPNKHQLFEPEAPESKAVAGDDGESGAKSETGSGAQAGSTEQPNSGQAPAGQRQGQGQGRGRGRNNAQSAQ